MCECMLCKCVVVCRYVDAQICGCCECAGMCVQLCGCGGVLGAAIKEFSAAAQQRNWDDKERSEGPKRKEGGSEGKEVETRGDLD